MKQLFETIPYSYFLIINKPKPPRVSFFTVHPGDLDVSKNRGFKPPKMDGKNNGKPYFLMDDLGVPFFWETPIWSQPFFSKLPTWLGFFVAVPLTSPR